MNQKYYILHVLISAENIQNSNWIKSIKKIFLIKKKRTQNSEYFNNPQKEIHYVNSCKALKILKKKIIK
jgi:hypothetical protein